MAKLNASKVLAYTVAGDEQNRRHLHKLVAVQLAVSLALKRPKDGEEYRNGVLENGRVVGTAIRHTDGSVTYLPREA